jgi:hypothetical protein
MSNGNPALKAATKAEVRAEVAPVRDKAIRFVFRGDTREPDVIFEQGFSARAAGPIWYRRAQHFYGAGDILPDSAVCVTARIAVAAMFPLNTAQPASWIYMIGMDQDALTSTHHRQVLDSIYPLMGIDRTGFGAKLPEAPDDESLQAYLAEHPDAVKVLLEHGAEYVRTHPSESMFTLFGHELATKAVPAAGIIAAVPTTRSWTGEDWVDGGRYALGEPVYNTHCTLPRDYKETAIAFLSEEVAHQPYDMPRAESGYHHV